ncbi:MAG: alpha/beta hydrolase [Rudaea sp.]
MIETRQVLGNRYFLTSARVLTLAALLLIAGCADVFFAVVDSLESSNNVQRHGGIVFDAKRKLALDVYRPLHAKNAPIVVFFYGGSWTSGERRWYRYIGDALAENGVVTFIPDYRKYPQVRFPAFVYDAARAVAWVHRNAKKYGGDPHRLFVMGHSAGGHIAAMLATDKRYLNAVGMKMRELSGFIGIAGAYSFERYVESEPEIFGNTRQSQFDSQPVNFVDGDEPPMLILQGEDDHEVEPDNAKTLYARAIAACDTATLKLYPHTGHAAIALAYARGDHGYATSLADTLAFIANRQPQGCASNPSAKIRSP